MNTHTRVSPSFNFQLDSSEDEKETEVLPNSSAHRLGVDDRLRVEFDHLDKFVDYSFRVVALNRNGPGMSTPKVVAKTHSDSKLLIRVGSLGSNGLTII